MKVSQQNKISLKRFKTLFWIVTMFLSLCHLVYFLVENKYLISSGIFLYIIFFSISYFLIVSIFRKINRRFNPENLRIVFISIAFIFIIIESIFILTGFKSTYLEKRDKYYYQSRYAAKKDKRYHLRLEDEYLETSEYSYYRKVNSLGLSDKEPELVKDTNEYRIIGIGDSFTEGDGAHADSTWLKFLERDLKKSIATKNLSFINSGVCGSDPCYEFVLLKEKLLPYKPDLVILMINHTDVFDLIIRGGMSRFKSDGYVKYNKAPWFEPIYAMSHISRVFFNAFGYDEFLIGKWENSEKPAIAEKQLFESLQLFEKLSEENDFTLLIVINPFKYEFDRGESCMTSIIDRIDKELNVEYINLLNYFNEVEGVDSTNYHEYFWQEDGHNNAKGYEKIANGIMWKLKRNGIYDSIAQ